MKTIMILILFFAVSVQAQHEHHHHKHKSLESSEHTDHSLFHLTSEWTTHKNKKVKFNDLEKKKTVLSMIFTSCETACPMLVDEMKEMQDKAKNKDINFYLFTFDSERDTPEKLTVFKNKKKLNSKWTLFHSKDSNIRELSNVLGVQYKKTPDNNFIHSNVIFVLNDKGEIICKKEGLRPNVEACLKSLNN